MVSSDPNETTSRRQTPNRSRSTSRVPSRVPSRAASIGDNMHIDDMIDNESDDEDYSEGNRYSKSQYPSIPKWLSLDPEIDLDDITNYLTTEDFTYSMDLIDRKINSLYKLCRFIGDQQHEDSKLLHKLVVADELSPDFWNVSNFDIFSFFDFEIIK